MADTLRVISNAGIAVTEREGLEIPSLTIPDDSHELAAALFSFFEDVWRGLGYVPMKSPHQAATLIPGIDGGRDIVIANTYRGLSDSQVGDRQPYLELYKSFRDKIRAATNGHSPQVSGVPDLQARAEKVREHLHDFNGVQGVHTYSLSLLPKGGSASARQTAGTANVIVSKTFALGPEAKTYDLPHQGRGTNPKQYPFFAGDWLNLIIERNPHYAVDHSETSSCRVDDDEAYVERWQFWVRSVEAAIDGTFTSESFTES